MKTDHFHLLLYHTLNHDQQLCTRPHVDNALKLTPAHELEAVIELDMLLHYRICIGISQQMLLHYLRSVPVLAERVGQDCHKSGANRSDILNVENLVFVWLQAYSYL